MTRALANAAVSELTGKGDEWPLGAGVQRKASGSGAIFSGKRPHNLVLEPVLIPERVKAASRNYGPKRSLTNDEIIVMKNGMTLNK